MPKMTNVDSLAGKYCSVDPLLPWDQRVDLDIIRGELGQEDLRQWTLRYNDRKYRHAPTTTLELASGDKKNIASFKNATYPHWITRRTVTASGDFEVTKDGTVTLYFTQVGQGMTGLETWTATLVKQIDSTSTASPNKRSTKLLDLIRSDFSAPNSQPTKPCIDALAVSKSDIVVLEEYFGGMTPATLHIISSSTKSITALLAGIAVEQGLFRLDDCIADYFPDVSTIWGGNGNSDSPPVLVRHVLSMTAGTEHTVKEAQDLLESTDVERLVLGWTSFRTPGAAYNYDNGLPALVGCLIERTSGIPLPEFAKKHLFGPLDINTVAWTDMPTPADRPYVSDPPVLAAGGMALTLPDFLKLGQMLLQNGQYNGRQIVPAAYAAEATRQQTKLDDYPYGYYFHINQRETVDDSATKEWVHLDGMDGYFMLGQGEQILFIAPKEQIVLAAFSSTWHRARNARPDRYAIMDLIKVALQSV